MDLEQLEPRNLLTGTWTILATSIPNSGAGSGTMILLTDGTVLVQGSGAENSDKGVTNTWYKLTPNASGSYVNGTWSLPGVVASMKLQRLYFGSNVLNDSHGDVFVMGGEFSGSPPVQNEINSGEIYDPVANTWTPVTPFPKSEFGDNPTMLLPNGNILTGGGAYLPNDQSGVADYT